MNSVNLMGRLTKDPEVRYTQSNIAVCGFTLAVDRAFAKEGEEKQADFFPCVCWDKKGEALSKYIAKGRRIAVTGRLQTRNWDDADGKKHYVTEIIVENWFFADDKKADAPAGNSASPVQQPSAQQAPPASAPWSQPQGSASPTDKPPWA